MRSARALPVLVAVALMNLASCDDDDGTSDSTPATTEAPAPTTTEELPATSAEAQLVAFSSERDDLCEWVTGGEVAEYVTAAGFAVEGPATASEPATGDATGWDCAWTFASGEELQLGVRDRPGRLDSLQQLGHYDVGKIEGADLSIRRPLFRERGAQSGYDCDARSVRFHALRS